MIDAVYRSGYKNASSDCRNHSAHFPSPPEGQPVPFDVIRGPGVPSSHLPFSPGVRAGGFVFVSGQASVDDTGAIVADTFEGEFRRSLENLRKVLAGAGLTLADVVQVRSYVDSPSDLAAYNRLYRDYFSEPFPARTTIVNCLGGALKYEIDAVAFGG